MNSDLIWCGKASEFAGWAKAMEDVYGKDALLSEVVKDLKQKRLNRQVNLMEEHYGYKKK